MTTALAATAAWGSIAVLLWASGPALAGTASIVDEISLGKALFSDRNLSSDRTVSCGFCHPPDFSFVIGLPFAIGVGGRTVVRKTPTLLDLPQYRTFFWDGRARSLLDQVRGPFLSPVELGFMTEVEVVRRVRANPSYVEAFQRLYHVSASGITLGHVAKAIVAFEKAIPPQQLRIDRFVAGDVTALSFQGRQGLQVFKGKAGCADCHLITERAAPFTDNQYHASSVGLHSLGAQVNEIAARVASLDELERFRRVASDPQVSDLGRFVVTLQTADIGKFRTPSLRHAASAYHVYMHDGSLSSLRDAIDQEIRFHGAEASHSLRVSPTERDAIRVFLEEAGQIVDPGPPAPARRPVTTAAPPAPRPRFEGAVFAQVAKKWVPPCNF